MRNSFYLVFILLVASCQKNVEKADMVITNARVYTLNWDDPAINGVPAINAPYKDGKWSFDAEAIAIKNGLILEVGSNESIEKLIGESTTHIDANQAVIVPGLIESHGHIQEIGEQKENINLRDLTGEDIIETLYKRSLEVPKGEWIVSSGWDEGKFANNYPDMVELSKKVPDHPVILYGLRGFGTMANKLAFEKAGITVNTQVPDGGEILKDEEGNLKYVLLNNARGLLNSKVPERTSKQKERILKYGLNELASLGFTTTHHAGVRKNYMGAYESLHAKNELPIRVHAFIATTEPNKELVNEWIEKGPTEQDTSFFQVRTFKAYYDGSLGSRGAKFLDDYEDMDGHTGVCGVEYGFHPDVVEKVLDAGFQLAIHAIGDKANRDVLDFYEAYYDKNPKSKALRHRIEHVQIVHPDDFSRFSELNVIASMEPAHAVEDMPWAIDRVGKERIKGGYAWRTLREQGTAIIFNSDLAGTDPDFFYGMHCAITRKKRNDEKSWFPEQALTPEESLRAYTIWGAYSAKQEQLTGSIEVGKWADLTFMDIDVLNEGITNPSELLNGNILKTMVNGTIVYEN